MVQQAAGPLPGAEGPERRIHFLLEQVQEARHRQVNLVGTGLGTGRRRRVALDALEHGADAGVHHPRAQCLAKDQLVKVLRLQVERAPRRDHAGVAPAHVGGELGGLHGACSRPQESGQPGQVDALGFDVHGHDVARFAGRLVGDVGLHDRHLAVLPGAVAQADAQRALQGDVQQDRALGVHGRRAQQTGVEDPVGRDPHHAFGAAAAPRRPPRALQIRQGHRSSPGPADCGWCRSRPGEPTCTPTAGDRATADPGVRPGASGSP